MLTLIPAYGRDYKSRAKVIADFDAQKDFVETTSSRYINKQQIAIGTTIIFRYGGLRKTSLYTVK